jgi:hypothetical protein
LSHIAPWHFGQVGGSAFGSTIGVWSAGIGQQKGRAELDGRREMDAAVGLAGYTTEAHETTPRRRLPYPANAAAAHLATAA